jgi:hypothetical protein
MRLAPSFLLHAAFQLSFRPAHRHVALPGRAGPLVIAAAAGWLTARTGAHTEEVIRERDLRMVAGVIQTALLDATYKYAYPADSRGEIRVMLRRSGDGLLTIAIEDDGVGWKGTGAAQGTGLGTRVITAMAGKPPDDRRVGARP